MMKKKRTKKNIIGFIILMILLVGCVVFYASEPTIISGRFDFREESNQLIRHIDDRALEGFPMFSLMQEDEGGSRPFDVTLASTSDGPLSFHPEYTSFLENETLLLDQPQQKFYIIVENFVTDQSLIQSPYQATPMIETFVLKLFYNLEEIEFRVDGSEIARDEFVFRLEEGYQVHIPIYLSEAITTNEYLNGLTVGLFGRPEYHTTNRLGNLYIQNPPPFGDIQPYSLIYGNENIRQFNLSFGGKEKPPLHEQYLTTNQIEANGVTPGFNLLSETDFQRVGNDDTRGIVASSPTVTHVGEEVTFFYSFDHGGGLNSSSIQFDSYAIVALLNWQHVELNGLPYALVDGRNTDHRGVWEQGSFTIKMPNEPGFYEFTAFLVVNPDQGYNPQLTENGLNGFVVISAMRFTLEVVEN